MTQKMTRRGWLTAMTAAVLLGGTFSAAEAAESPYKGTTIRFLTSSNVHQNAFIAKLEEIAKEWGIIFESRKVTTDQLKKKVVLDFVGGAETWDLIYTGGVQRAFEWFDRGILEDITPLIAKHGDAKLLDWEGFSIEAQNAVALGDKILGIAMATSDQALAYRKDIFGNADEQAAFKAKYGYALQPPETYAQYRDVAEFFTRKKGEKLAGKVLENDFYGISNSNKKGTYLWHDYENQLVAFGAEVCNPKTLEAGLSSPASIEAAEYYQSLVPFWPSNHINMSSGESTTTFATGRVAMIIEYFDRVVSTVAKDKTPLTSDKVGYTFPPTKVGNPRGLKHPFRAGPAVVSIYSLSKNKEAAYKLLEAAVSAESQLDMARNAKGYMPTRLAPLKTLAQEMPVVQYLIDVFNGGATGLSDAQMMPYPCILKSSEIGDYVSTAMSAILVGGDVKEELGKGQEKLAKALATLKK
jgi:multiple sugar transport system substrate-binding protein